MIKEILDRLEQTSPANTKLYFISRVLKENVKKTSKVLDKYLFKAYQVDIDDAIRKHLYNLTREQLSLLHKKKAEMTEYDVVTDDTEQLLTYSMVNKGLSFQDVVERQLKGEVPKVSSLEEILKIEELWAYCVGFAENGPPWLLSFRKLLAGKVAVDEGENPQDGKISKTIRALFNTQSKKLELIEGETVNLDKQLDCIFYNETFYISKKTQFEQIIGLEEEYKQQAMNVVDELRVTGRVEGLDVLDSKILNDPAVHKKLVRLKKIGIYNAIDEKGIKRMERVCRKMGFALQVEGGKLVIKSEKDIDLVLKVLADFFKRGMVSKKRYGTYSGREIKRK